MGLKLLNIYARCLLLLGAVIAINSTAKAQCNANFSFATDTVCSKTTISFTDSSTGTGGITYLWDFDDASSPSNFSNAQNPTHSFVDTGLLTVKLIITDGTSCSDTLTKDIYILKAPVASFTRFNNCVQSSTSFKNITTAGSVDSVSTWKWLFGTGDSSTQKNPTYNYSATGTFSVKLIATTVKGCRDTATQSVQVYSKPVIGIADTQFCAQTSVAFDVQITEVSNVAFSWRFGDGNSSVSQSPLHIYNTGGIYRPRIKVTHSGTDSCFATFDSVTVYGLPQVNFSINNDSQCYAGNNVCITDQTTQGTNGGNITKRTIVFGDGFIDNTTPPATTLVCHQYTDPNGGSYPITIEATDANLCFASKQLSPAIVIFPALTPSFTVAEVKDCFTTKITITNTSGLDSSKLSNFTWTYGDGDSNTTQWDNRTHTYTTTGNYQIQLSITDTFGCIKTATAQTATQSVVLNFNPAVSKDTSCFYNNTFVVSNPVNNNADGIWSFGEGNDDTGWALIKTYDNPGNFTIRLRIVAENCDTQSIVKTVTVLGPRANIGSPINRYQCVIHDTVYFTGASLPYLSNHGPAPGNIKRIWTFGDVFAPQCTTDTKNNINIGLNCNYSKDSMDVKHWYTPGQEACYSARLYLEDTVWGCVDTSRIFLALQAPIAKNDSSVIPPIPGLSFSKPDCLGPELSKNKLIFLDNTQPSCARELYWVMWDSLCARQSGNFDANWQIQVSSHNYDYTNPPCDTSGRVTLGLIIRNGTDAGGDFCYDTAWYHHVFQFNDLYPFITHDFNPAVSRCEGTTINFRVTDTTQSGITNYSWNFGDGSAVVSGANAYKTQHTFNQKGSFDVILTMQNADGCTGTATETINIGFESDFTLTPVTACIGDTIFFDEEVNYFDIGSALWTTPARHNGGKETLNWDFGDGNGFNPLGSNPFGTFDKVGTYNVRLALKDSSGCRDTVTMNNAFTIYGTYARLLNDDTLVCPQLFRLLDSSRIYDPTNYLSIPAGDSIASWEWTVLPNNLKSFLQNPYFDFSAGGNYTLKLKVENTRGCIDSTQEDFYVKGPVPYFTIVSDTTGCSPLRVEFDNQSTNANKYTWSFRDALSNTITTLSDTNVYNIYAGGGLYKPFLTAESSEYDSKQARTVTCRAVYPDTSTQTIRLVAVNATPVVAFGASNACTSFSINFTDSSTIDSGSITQYLWKFGDGNTSVLQNPTHIYADTGTYTVTLFAYGSSGCSDSLQKTIPVAPPPTANFGVLNTCANETAEFYDSSETNNAYVVRWEWDFGDLTTSVFQNPTHTYGLTNTYPVKLKILTNAGCTDSVTKSITINPVPALSFTAANACQDASVTLTHTSTISSGSVSYFWDFGNGTTSSQSIPALSYPADGNYTIKLLGTSNFGCKDSISQSITISPLPQTDFAISDSTQCINTNAFAFTNQTNISSGTYTSDWNFSDGNSLSNSQNANYTYVTPGTYIVFLTAKSNFNCNVAKGKRVYVYPKPTAGFTVNDTAQCFNTQSFVFTNTSVDTGALTYAWNFGDGGSSALVNPVRTYQFVNPYTVTLIATNGNQCSDTATNNTRVLPIPSPSFTINDTGQCVNDNLFLFTNTSTISTGTLTALWNFGNSNTSSANSPSETYTTDTSYTVQLISVSNRGCRDTITRTLTVFPKPFPAFIINDTNQCINTNQYQFTNQSTIKYGTNTYKWFFGDGDSLAGTNANHQYSTDADYTVTLKATSDNGCIDSTKNSIILYPKPQADFAMNDTDQCLNTNSFVFTGLSTVKSGNLRYMWNFSGGFTSTQKDTTIVYGIHSQYNVTLIVRSDFDCYDTTTAIAYVYPVPIPNFTVNDTDQCLQENNFAFTNQSVINSGFMTYGWTFGTEGTSIATSPSFVFTGDITHNIKLKATSDKQCTDSMTKQVIVYPSPVMAFTINDTNQCVNGNLYNYTNQTVIKYGTLTYNWTFGDGFTSTATDTSIVYNNYGVYTPRLIAISDNNCPDTLTKNIRVYAKPNVLFTVNDTDQCLKGNVFGMTNLSAIGEGTMNHKWYWGNGDTANSQQPSYTYPTDSSLYTIKLVVTSNFNCKDSTTQQVVVYPQTEIGFTINDTGQCINGNQFVYTNSTTLKSGTLTYSWDLGDGFTSTETDTTVIYTNFGIYNPRLIATTNYGCKDTLVDTIQVFAKPDVQFAVNDSDQCLSGNVYQINNTSSIPEGTISYLWRWGNGDTASATQPQYSYPLDSTYIIQVIVTSNFDCKDSLSRQVVVYPQPQIDFAINDSGQCVNNNLFTFTNSSLVKYGNLTYNWNFGDGKTAVAKDTNVVYTYDSTFRSVLRATTNFGCTDTLGKYVVVHSKPNPDFAVNDTDQCFNDNLFVFTNQTTIKQGTSTYDWDFGNGATDTATHPQYIYTIDTTYRVRLLATSDFLCVDSITQTMLVFPKPQAAFTVNDSSQCINTNNFVYTNGSTIKYGTLTYEWYFGNGDTASAINPVYVYPLQGTFASSLVALSDNGCYDTARGTSILFPKPNPDFNINDTDQCLKTQNFVFTNTSTIDSGNFTNHWIFSDGVEYTDSVNVTRTFGNPTRYTVKLVLTSDELCIDSTQQDVIVYPHPNPNFTGLKLYYCADDDLLPLSPIVAGGIFEGKNMQNDTFAPLISGADTVKYTVQVNGCFSDTSKYTTVFALPTLSISSDTNLCRKEFILINITSPNATYLWSTGSSQPTIKITQPGQYIANLYHICDTLMDTVTVTFKDFDCNFFFPNAFTPNADGLNDVFLPYFEDDVQTMTLTIFNRWGQVIFVSDDLTKGWDGTYQEEPVQDGVYTWTVDLSINESGDVYRHTAGGQVHLIR